jgi:uncharacterized membrane-anchored protein YhcB (DUF1043 family)
METDDPTKKNDESINDPIEFDPSLEQENQPDLTKSSEEIESEEEILEEIEDEVETEPETVEDSTESTDPDQSAYEASEPEVVDAAVSEPPSKPMPKWLKNSLIFLVVGLILLLAGYLIAYFTSTIPKQNLYQTTVNELQETKSQLDDLNIKYDQLTNDLSEVNNEFDTLQSDYEELDQEFNDLLQTSEFAKNLLSLKYEVANARYYLLKVDRISSRQAIILAIDYFDAIKDDLEPDISSGVEDRLESIQKSINTKPDAALDELGTLFENLERIPLD